MAPRLTSGQKTRAHRRQEMRFDTAQRRSHHQQRREHSTRGAGAERRGPNDGLDQQHSQQQSDFNVALQQVADGS